MPIWLAGEESDYRLVNENAFAFLTAMLLDQQISILWAFQGPQRLVDKVSKALNVNPTQLEQSFAPTVAEIDLDDFVEIVCAKPTIHRYPAVMAKRISALAQHITDLYDGSAEKIWHTETNAQTVYQRLVELPGFGEEKAKITLAVLAKRFDIELAGWEALAAPFSDNKPRSVANAGSPEEYEAIKAWKKEQKSKGLKKTD